MAANLALLSALSISPMLAGGLAIVGVELHDNGDDDGFADTYETVRLRLQVQNTTDVDLHGVSLRLSTVAPEVSCISRPLIYLGDLTAGESRRSSDAFVFTMGDVDRQQLGLDEYGDLTIEFAIMVFADELGEPTIAPTITFEIDLNVIAGSGRTTFLEDFESGTMATFTADNQDALLYGLAASDGYRCQYNDPDWSGSNNYGETSCHLGALPEQADVVHWQIDGPGPDAGWPGRGFSGSHSLYFGVELDPALGHTTPMAALESASTTDPIDLDAGRVCESDGATPCIDELDCPAGDRCTGVSSALSIMHQISLVDSRVEGWFGETVDRGVVHAQIANDLGDPVGDWIKLQPYLNLYDVQAIDHYSTCSFDPIDDGNTEDDFFDPTDPDRRLGPSSTCTGAPTFALLGDTWDPYDPTNLGNADGPGLAGETGPGTWVESRFNLDRFKGRRVRLRFLSTTLKVSTFATWEDFLTWNPNPVDDGWWIDDVTVTHVLATPTQMLVDLAPNDALPGREDGDADGVIDACDTCPSFGDPGQADLDADGVGDSCDNCLDFPNPGQTDADADGLGDACDTCPEGDADDLDLDLIVCSADNCPVVSNVDQTDTDDDGNGDACDPCPLDPDDDVDADGFCADADNCATRSNPGQTEVVDLSGSAQLRASVIEAVFSPDGRYVVYLADGDLLGRDELYAVPVAGGSSTKISGELAGGGDVVGGFVVDPTSSFVVYVADQDQDEVFELYASPLDGSPGIKLNPPLVTDGDVDPFVVLSPDGSTIVYRADQEADGRNELFSVPADGGTAAKLNDPLTAGSNVEEYFAVSPDSAHVVYVADQDTDDVFELYSVPIGGGSVVKLNDPLPLGGNVRLDPPSEPSIRIAGDPLQVFYVADQIEDDVEELFWVPIDGGAVQRVNDNLGFSQDVQRYSISPDGLHVVYWVGSSSIGEIFSTPVTGGLPVQLNHLSVRSYRIDPSSARVVYLVGTNGPYRRELFSVPIDASEFPTQLNPPLGDEGDVRFFTFDPDGSTVVYEAFNGPDRLHEIFAVPIGGGSALRLNFPLSSLEWVADPVVTPDGSTVIYRKHRTELYRVPLEGGSSQLLGAIGEHYWGMQSFLVSPDGESVVYTSDPNGYRLYRLFGVPIDTDEDEDGVVLFCDTCPETSNPDQTADTDYDLDGLDCNEDNCPLVANTGQVDADLDGVGDLCDNCPSTYDPSQTDSDGDGPGNVCDPCPYDPLDDSDADGLCANDDTCPDDYDPGNRDADGDGLGDLCDPCRLDPTDDGDGDGLCADQDNCPWVYNPLQANSDSDGAGDPCDNCPLDRDPGLVDSDLDGVGDLCDCRPNDPLVLPPLNLAPLLMHDAAGGSALLAWPAVPGADSYSVTRGAIGAWSGGDFGSCLTEGIASTSHEDGTLPAPGQGFAYLVQGYSNNCGMGMFGLDSTETHRSNSNPAACSGFGGAEASRGLDQETGGRSGESAPRHSIR